MKRFCFSLRSVAVLRAHREMRARDLFATAVHAYVQTEEFLAGVRVRTAALETALRAGRSAAYRAAEMANSLADYRRECAAEIEAERAVFAARAEMDRCRAAYFQAHMELKAVQRLEEKARTSHRLEANRVEQAEFDEFAGRRAAMGATCTR